MGSRRSRAVASGTVLLALMLAGCAGAVGGDPGGVSGAPPGSSRSGSETGTWELQGTPSPEATEVAVLVTRLECASGVTGEVLAPVVHLADDRVVIETPVADNGSDAAECPSNDAVSVTVRLGEPLGNRSLVDGACLTGEAADLVMCEEPERWRPE